MKIKIKNFKNGSKHINGEEQTVQYKQLSAQEIFQWCSLFLKNE